MERARVIDDLEKSDFVSLSLSGKSLKELGEQGKRFWFRPTGELGSMRSSYREVIVPSLSPFIPKSNNHRLKGQFEVLPSQLNDLKVYNQLLQDSFEGLQAIIADLATYAEIAHLFYQLTGRRYFDGKWARTSTQDDTGLFPQILEISDKTPDYVLNYGDSNHPHALKNTYGVSIGSWFKSGWGQSTFVFPVVVVK